MEDLLKEIIDWTHTSFGTSFGYVQTPEERGANDTRSGSEATYVCHIYMEIYDNKYYINLEQPYDFLDCNHKKYDTLAKCQEEVNHAILGHNRKIKIDKILSDIDS